MSSGANQPVTLVDVKKGLDALAAEVEQGYEYARRIHNSLCGTEPTDEVETKGQEIPIGAIAALYSRSLSITGRLISANERLHRVLLVIGKGQDEALFDQKVPVPGSWRPRGSSPA